MGTSRKPLALLRKVAVCLIEIVVYICRRRDSIISGGLNVCDHVFPIIIVEAGGFICGILSRRLGFGKLRASRLDRRLGIHHFGRIEFLSLRISIIVPGGIFLGLRNISLTARPQ